MRTVFKKWMKLNLNRETVKALDPKQLAGVHGGLTSSIGQTDLCPSATCMCETDGPTFCYCGH